MSDKPLSNRRLELVAQQLARGATTVDASIAAGYRNNGPAFASNCRQRANYPKVKARVAALQAKGVEGVNVDLAWICERLVEIATRGPFRESVKVSDRLRAIDMLIRLRGDYAPEKRVVTHGGTRSVRMTETFDGEKLKTGRVVDLIQGINDENSPAELRIEAAKAALPYLESREPVPENDGGGQP
jgi:hypothetical protein